jgi:co-chaperonin GroES (HSP10)
VGSAADKIITGLEEAIEAAPEIKHTQLPKMVGYHLLIAPLKAEQKTEGGIWKPDNLVDLEQSAAVCGLVIGMGPDAYADKDRFKEPWAKEGDFVVIGAYKGTRIKIHGEEFRVINDDQVLGVVDDPRGYTRA